MYKNSIKANLQSIPQQNLVSEIENRLVRLSAKNINVNGNNISFQVDFLRFVMSWNILIGISNGEINIDYTKNIINYHLNFSHLYKMGAVLVVFLSVPIAFQTTSIIEIIGVVAFFWFGLVGINSIITKIRFKMFLISVVRKIK